MGTAGPKNKARKCGPYFFIVSGKKPVTFFTA